MILSGSFPTHTMLTKHEIGGISTNLIEEQLRRIQTSPLFSHSRRYPSFLDFVVRKTLEGHEDELKERTVGVEAFGRQANYDLNADPIVRVTAGEVRKRLAQYYYQAGHEQELRIELNPGSYVPEFRLPTAAMEPAPESVELAVSLEHSQPALADDFAPQLLSQFPLAEASGVYRSSAQRWKTATIVLAVAFVIASAVAMNPMLHRNSTIDAFWKPVLDANGRVLISVGSVVAMVNSFAVAPPANTVSGHPLSSDPIAVSDAVAMSAIQQVLSVRSKASSLEISTSTSFSDLQNGPSVLISGFNNQWTMRITDPLRFHFVRTSTDEYAIEDRQDPKAHWSINTAGPFVKMSHDYGLVARFHDPTTEQIVMVAAGIGENGTVAASRLLTDERYLSELKQEHLFPRYDQNFECIVETQIIDGKPGPPRVVASYIW